MPPRIHHRESASELETKSGSTSRAANKARNAVAVAAQQELLLKHIHSNGPHDKPKINPLDFLAFDDATLHKYTRKHGMGLPPVQSVNDNILQSEIGKKTFSSRRAAGYARITKPELASHCHKHFVAAPCRENEIITSFLYKVKNEDKDFKLMF